MEAVAEVEEVAMVTTAEGSGFPEDVRDLRPPLCPTTWPPARAPGPVATMLLFLILGSGPIFPPSATEPSLAAPGPAWANGTSWKLAVVKRAPLSSNRFCEGAGREATPPPEALLQV